MKFDIYDISIREGNKTDGCVHEHPFQQRNRRIPLDKVFEEGEVERETKLCDETEDGSPYSIGTTRGFASLKATQDKDQRTGCAEKDSAKLLAGDRFLDRNSSYNHSRDR